VAADPFTKSRCSSSIRLPDHLIVLGGGYVAWSWHKLIAASAAA